MGIETQTILLHGEPFDFFQVILNFVMMKSRKHRLFFKHLITRYYIPCLSDNREVL